MDQELADLLSLLLTFLMGVYIGHRIMRKYNDAMAFEREQQRKNRRKEDRK